MATPRTVGLMPRHRVRPALPNVSFSWSRLPTWPTVAMQSIENLRTSPLGIFTSARSPSLLSNCAAPPAERTAWPPRPGYNSRLCTIGVMQQRDVGAAIGVIFDGRNLRGYADFVAPEIHLAVLLLMPAAAMPNHDFAVVVAAAGALFWLEQSLFGLLLGDMAFVQDGDKPPRRCIWIKAFQSHRYLLPSYFFPAPPDNLSSCAKRRISTLNLANAYKFSAYSIIFSPSASFT